MRRPEHFYKLTAEQLNQDLTLVTKVNKFFWKVGVKEVIRKGQKPAIFIRNIGTLFMVKKRIREHIMDKVRYWRSMKRGDSEMLPEQKMIDFINTFKELLKLRDTHAKLFYKVRKRKKRMKEQGKEVLSAYDYYH